MGENVILAIYAVIGFIKACIVAYLCGLDGQDEQTFFIAVMSAFFWPFVLLAAAAAYEPFSGRSPMTRAFTPETLAER